MSSHSESALAQSQAATPSTSDWKASVRQQTDEAIRVDDSHAWLNFLVRLIL
jgi:hypothetical protein